MSKFLLNKYFNRILFMAISSGLLFLTACGDDDSNGGGGGTDPIEINFSTGALTISENSATPLTITVNLGSAAVDPESFDVNLTGADYGTEYTTTPDGTSGSFNLDVAAAGQFTTFTLSPIDNDEVDGDKTVTITLSNPSDGLELGATSTLIVTIEDDEIPVTITPIADIRALYDPAMAVNITDDLLIEGVVTSRNEAVTSRNLFLQDESGAIVLRFDETHSFVRGNTLRISIQGADVDDFNDLVQVVNNLPLANATDMGAGTLPTPEVVTIDQLNSGNYQAQLITIENVYIEEADGAETFSGNNTITDLTSEATIRSESFSDFSGDVLPLGQGNVTGLAGIFGGTNQILPQERADVFADNPAGTMTVTQTIADFGSVETNSTSASQSYTVESTGAVENILVEAPDQFEVSLDDAAFSSSVEVDFAASNAGPVTVFIRFAPTSGVAGAAGGDVTHSTLAIAGQSFAVSGTETAALAVIAGTSFENGTVGGQYTDTGDASMDHDLVNNAGESEVDFTAAGGEIGLDASYVNTRNDVGLTDGDFVGFSDFTGTVGAFTDGAQGYQMSDTDGKMVVTFDAVDLTGTTTSKINLDLFVQATGWEADDNIRIYVIVDGAVEVDILNTVGLDIDDNFTELEGVWTDMTADLSGNTTATLVVELDSNSGSEAIYLDNVRFSGD